MVKKEKATMEPDAVYKARVWSCDACGRENLVKTNHCQSGVGHLCPGCSFRWLTGLDGKTHAVGHIEGIEQGREYVSGRLGPPLTRRHSFVRDSVGEQGLKAGI